MHHLVPRFILEKYKNNQRAGRFEAASLFIDVAGFTALTDELMSKGSEGSEELAEVMRSVFSPLINAIHYYDGFVATLAGDAITAIFPQKNGDSLDRALECASHLPPVFEAKVNDLEISARFGLAYGEIQWGIVESESRDRATYYFAGEPIDHCVDVQQKASKNEVRIHGSLQQHASAAYDDFLRKQDDGTYSFLKRGLTPLLPVADAIPEEYHHLSHLFFPKELLEQEIPGEFRQVVNVFIQLPKDLAEEQFTNFMQTLFALQRSYGGILNRLDFSDKGAHLYLFWGAPISFESDIERALGFVLDIRTKTGISIRAGISHREVHAGFIGSNLREEYTCHGRCVNLAARLMVSAPPGEIWLDAEVAQRAEKTFDVELENPIRFKGFSEEQQVFVLYERKEETQSFFATTLFGREEELKTITEFVRPIFDSRYAGNLLIVGDAGSGKSHLIHTLVNSDKLVDRAQWLTCQTSQIMVTSLNPFRYMLKRSFGFSDKQSEEINKRNFNRRVNKLIANCGSPEVAAELERTQSVLGALLGLRWLDSLYEQLEPQSRLENSFLALVAYFQALSLERPLIIFVEDAHWLDADSKSFLVQLDRMLKAAEVAFPIALLISARPVDDLLPADLSYKTIELALLNQRHIESLTTAFLGETAAEVLDLIFTRSQGNPFFAEQIARYLQEQEQLQQIGGKWQFVTDAEQTSLPLDVRTVLIARIDLLSKGVKEIVQTAAILGREFDVQLLSQILQSARDLTANLSKAENAAVWTALNELRYLFKHALLRDAAYDMQLVRRRKALHKLAVESLETLYEDGLSNYYPELAYHSEQAELTKKARLYLELAGDGATEAFQNEQAVDFYSRALTLIPGAEKSKLFELKIKRESVYGVQGQHERQAEELEELSKLAAQLDLDSKLRVELRRALYLYDRALYGEVIQTVEQALPQMDPKRDVDHLFRSHILLGRAFSFYDAGASREEAKNHFKQAMGYAERSNNLEYVAEGLLYSGAVHRYHDDKTAKRYFEESLGITESLISKSSILLRLGSIARRTSEFETAKANYQEALDLATKVGSPAIYGQTLLRFGDLSRELFEYDKAESYYTQAERTGIALNYGKLASDGAIYVAHIQLQKGQLRGALLKFTEIYERQSSNNRDASTEILLSLHYMATLCVRLGELQQAIKYLEMYLIELHPRFGYDEMEARIGLANMWIDLSNFARANEELAKAQKLFGSPEKHETSYARAVEKFLDVQDAAIKAALASSALNENDVQSASHLMDDVVAILAKYESHSYTLAESWYPYAHLFYQSYTVLKVLNRPEASKVLTEAYKRVIDLSQTIGKTEEEQKQVWQEDRFMRGIVEDWQAEHP